jgi:hypothetical protein
MNYRTEMILSFTLIVLFINFGIGNLSLAENMKPTWQNQGTNSTTNIINQSQAINLTAQGKDETTLDWAWLSTNETGNWVNYTNGTGGSWWNSYLHYRCKITLSETQSIGRTNELVIINGSDLSSVCTNILNAKENSIRVINSSNIEITSKVHDWDPTKTTINYNDGDMFDSNDDIVFLINITGNTQQNYSIYYDTQYNTSASYSLNLTNYTRYLPVPQNFDLFSSGEGCTNEFISGQGSCCGITGGYSGRGGYECSPCGNAGSIRPSATMQIPAGVKYICFDQYLAATQNACGQWDNCPCQYTRFYLLDSSENVVTQTGDSCPGSCNAWGRNCLDVSAYAGNGNQYKWRWGGYANCHCTYIVDDICFTNSSQNCLAINKLATSEENAPSFSTYNSPMNMNKDSNWQWSNFTWQNTSVDDTIVGWKIYYNDTSNNINGTNVMTFNVSTPPKECQGNIKFIIDPMFATPTAYVIPSVSGLKNCERQKVYFRQDSCSGQPVSFCTISAGECTGNSFAVSQSSGAYTYYACMGGKEMSLIYMVGYSNLPEFDWIGLIQIMMLASVALIFFRKS